MLSQLTYVSNRTSICTDAEIENILASCKKNNPTLKITGVLLYSNKKFIQMVEGDAELITSLFDKIKLDNRHSNCTLISLGAIKEKTFPSWHMGAKKIGESLVDFKTNISEDDHATFNSILNANEVSEVRILNFLKNFL